MSHDKYPIKLPGGLLKKSDGALPPDNILDTWAIEPGGSEPMLPPGQDIPELTEIIAPEGEAAALHARPAATPESPSGFASAQEFLRAQALRVDAPPLQVEAPPKPVLSGDHFDDLTRHLENALQAALAQAMAQVLETFAADAEAIARRIAVHTARTLADEYQQALAAQTAQGDNSSQNPV